MEKMNRVAPHNQLVGEMPKIGIRPTIDGRRGGVRESLEDQTMGMARRTAAFLSEHLRHANGLPVECVVADTCIGGVAEAAATAETFARENVAVSLTVTPCWCYGSETMDMDPLTPKAIWGFNGTERPGAVYLAAVLAAHNQKGLPAFGIYGRDVQDADDTSIPGDVQEKLLRFARAGLAVARMRGKSYLGMGGVSMGIAGSIVDPGFFEEYLGMRVESVDMTEFVRRFEEKIYDPVEFEQALDWVGRHCTEGEDRNPPEKQRTREQKDEDWATSVKMALIARDSDGGQRAAGGVGVWRGGAGAQRHRRRVPGAAPVDRLLPQRRFHGGDSLLLGRLEWHPRALYSGDGERRAQRRLHALRQAAHGHGAALRRRAHLLEPGGGGARHGLRTEGDARRAASCT